MPSATHRIIEDYLGGDWYGLVLGGFFLAFGLVLALAAVRYFYRRKGPAAAFAFALVFWGGAGGALVALTGAKTSWPSLAAAGAAALVSLGYAWYLAAFRKNLRLSPEEINPQPAPALRKCSGCGLNIDAKLAKCPMCGAERPPA